MSHDSAVSVLPFHGPRGGFLLSSHLGDASDVFYPADSRPFHDRELMDVCSFIRCGHGDLSSSDELKARLQTQDVINKSNRDSFGEGEFEAFHESEAIKCHGGEGRSRNLVPYKPQAVDGGHAYNAVGHGQRDEQSPNEPLFNTQAKPGNLVDVEESKPYHSQGLGNSSSGSDVSYGFSQKSSKTETDESHSQGIRGSAELQGFIKSGEFHNIGRSKEIHAGYDFNDNLHKQDLDPIISQDHGVGGLTEQNACHGFSIKLHVQSLESLSSQGQGIARTTDQDASHEFTDKLHAQNSESLITGGQCIAKSIEVNTSHDFIEKSHTQNHGFSKESCNAESRILSGTLESNIYHNSKVEHTETPDDQNVAGKINSHRQGCQYRNSNIKGERKGSPILPSIKISSKAKANKGFQNSTSRLRKYHSLSSTSDLIREEAWERKKVLYGDDSTSIIPSSQRFRPVTRSISDCGNIASWGEQTTPSSSRSRLRSLTDEDLEELRGCIDLGFGFSSSSGDDLDLRNTLPALELYLAINRQYDDIKSRSSPSSTLDGSVLSRSSSGDSNSHSSPLNDPLCMSSPGDHPSRVKTRLRHWAQAVACSIKQGFSL